MEGSILVAYATRSGSTKEVAEAVAAALREAGREADLKPAREVRGLEGYRSVVLGAPLYMFRWHKDASGFLSRNREGLMTRPVAVFALGPFHDEEKEWQSVRELLDKELVKYPWLKPATKEVFGGKFDPARLGFPFNMIPALKKMPPSDIRNWDAIRDWAGGLAKIL
jgi:menaquinone-dependent protoporphyrinogen oxidase